MMYAKVDSFHGWITAVLIGYLATHVSAGQFGNFGYTDNGTEITVVSYPTIATGDLVIPESIDGKPVTIIGDYAFNNCIGLTSITIPNGVRSINSGAFNNCSGLNKVTLPNTIASIGIGAFKYCIQLKSITIPDSVKVIPNYAFYYCRRLANVTIPNNVTCIGEYAFQTCDSLKSLIIPDSVTVIGKSAFRECSILENVSIPSTTTAIHSNSFSHCIGLKSVTIPSGVTEIEDFAFAYCSALPNVTIPSSVTKIGIYAFSDCTSLKGINVDSMNSAYSSLDGILFNRDQSRMIRCPGGFIGSFSIPGNITSIEDSVFSSCKGLTAVTIPESVTNIGTSAFSSCSNLTSVTIPGNVTSVGSYAFQNCSSLTSITIPSSVTTIGSYSFQYCSKLASAYFLGHPPSTGQSMFGSTASGFTIYYFNESTEPPFEHTHYTSPTWRGYSSVNMGDFAPVTLWLISNGLPYNTDLQSDPNCDGVNLLLAYALDLDPKQNLSASMPRPLIMGGLMGLTFYAGRAGVSYIVESSANLKDWSASEVTLSALDANNNRTARVIEGSPNCFMRLVVTY